MAVAGRELPSGRMAAGYVTVPAAIGRFPPLSGFGTVAFGDDYGLSVGSGLVGRVFNLRGPIAGGRKWKDLK